MARNRINPKFKTPEEALQIVDDYLKKYPLKRTAKTPEEIRQALENASAGILPTITGTAIELGLETIDNFIHFAKKPRYKRCFASIRARLQEYFEQGLATGRGSQGVMMWLDKMGTNFQQNQPLNNSGQPLLNVLVIGADGSRSPLTSLVNTINAPLIEQKKSPQSLEIPTLAKPKTDKKKAKATARKKQGRTKAQTS